MIAPVGISSSLRPWHTGLKISKNGGVRTRTFIGRALATGSYQFWRRGTMDALDFSQFGRPAGKSGGDYTRAGYFHWVNSVAKVRVLASRARATVERDRRNRRAKRFWGSGSAGPR